MAGTSDERPSTDLTTISSLWALIYSNQGGIPPRPWMYLGLENQYHATVAAISTPLHSVGGEPVSPLETVASMMRKRVGMLHSSIDYWYRGRYPNAIRRSTSSPLAPLALISDVNELRNHPDLLNAFGVVSNLGDTAGVARQIPWVDRYLEVAKAANTATEVLRRVGGYAGQVAFTYSAFEALTGSASDARAFVKDLAYAAPGVGLVLQLIGDWLLPAAQTKLYGDFEKPANMRQVLGSQITEYEQLQWGPTVDSEVLRWRRLWGSPLDINRRLQAIPDWMLTMWFGSRSGRQALSHLPEYSPPYAQQQIMKLLRAVKWAPRVQADLPGTLHGSGAEQMWHSLLLQVDVRGAEGYSKAQLNTFVTKFSRGLADAVINSGPKMMQPSKETLARAIKAYIIWGTNMPAGDKLMKMVAPNTRTYLWTARLILRRYARSGPAATKRDPRLQTLQWAHRHGLVAMPLPAVTPPSYSGPPDGSMRTSQVASPRTNQAPWWKQRGWSYQEYLHYLSRHH